MSAGNNLTKPIQLSYQFDFPVVLSGHDHHRVDVSIEGTRLLKPGLDAIAATLLELSWADPASPRTPAVSASFIETADWPADAALAEECERAYDALLPLRNTELARVPPTFEPLSSRCKQFAWTCVFDGPLPVLLAQEALEAEIKADETLGVVFMPGWLLDQGVGSKWLLNLGFVTI
ncbi:hypothetical protein T492DRAFT_849506 [Pavlovales sp. CCMP2436]|nr:hypothetical protein T492DRAFT_849506 [Pavlovales sp. CCMP2436]